MPNTIEDLRTKYAVMSDRWLQKLLKTLLSKTSLLLECKYSQLYTNAFLTTARVGAYPKYVGKLAVTFAVTLSPRVHPHVGAAPDEAYGELQPRV